MNFARQLACLLSTLFFLSIAPAYAHKPSDSYLSISTSGQKIEGQWDIALRDLELAVGLDGDGNSELTWNEIQAKHAEIAAYALSRLSLNANGTRCPLHATGHLIDNHTDGAYAVMRFSGECGAPITQLDIRYNLLFDLDPQHRGLLKLSRQGRTETAIFSPNNPAQQFATGEGSRIGEFITYLEQGVWHIWIGFDHILFLLSLLLPAVLFLKNKQWQASDSFKTSFFDVLKIVTAFTIAHSITLTLASLQIVTLPSRWVESAIAASVVIAAINNVIPMFHGQRWIAAFVFGLIHGFGFASVLGDLGLPQASLLLSLVGFNVGVELGQLAIVAAFLPVAYLMRGTWVYRRLIMSGGSTLIALIALGWLAERALDLNLMPI